MDTIKRIKQRLALGVLTIGMAFSLTGCTLPAELQSSLITNFTQRADDNKTIAQDLYSAGIISEDTHKQLVESINKNLGQLGETIEEDNTSMYNLLKSCVGWRIVTEPEHWEDGARIHLDNPVASTQCPEFAGQFLTNYLINSSFTGTVKTNVPAVGGNSGKVAPIEVIPESLVKQLNEELSVPIYALKKNVSSSGGSGLDELIEAVKKAADTKNTVEAERLLSVYFDVVKYVDEEGVEHKATLMDPNNPSQQIVRVTSGSYDVDETYDGTKFTGTKVSAVGKEEENYAGPNFPTEGGNKPGIDMTVKMSGEDILAVRLVEFNQKAIEELRSRIGLNEKRYVVLNGKAFLMEYPLGYVKGFKETEDRQGYNSIIEQSNLGFNILTGKFSKFNSKSDGTLTNESVVISDVDPYLAYAGAENNLAESQSSLVLYGETGVTKTDSTTGSERSGVDARRNRSIADSSSGGGSSSGTSGTTGVTGVEIDETLNIPFNMKFSWGEEEFTASIGRIVLRDYLELTYAPDVMAGEDLIVLGRKLRLLNLEGKKSDAIARFYDKEGKLLADSSDLFIDDFADIEDAIGDEGKLTYISRKQEALNSGDSSGDASENSRTSEDSEDGTATVVDTSSSESTSESSDDTDIIKGGASKLDKLEKNIASEIECSTSFPGDLVGKADKSLTDQKPLFYSMLVKKSMFETGLFSGWVQSTDDTKNSTVWWNKWLSEHGFSYRINDTELVKYLKGNYAYDLNKAGIIVLDLETIAKIQTEYQEQHKTETAHGLRSVFIVLGYILIAYSIVLMISWNVDVNVDFGFNILEKISFGKWVAVKDYEELPNMNTDETSFIRFGQLLVSCIGIISLGIILITVNIIDVIILIIQLFGGVAEYITRIITGVN